MKREKAKLLESEPDKAATGFQKELEDEAHDRWMRRLLGGIVGGAVVVWLFVLIVLLFLEGFRYRGFDLGDGVLSAAIGATAVFGLLGIILRYYFPRR